MEKIPVYLITGFLGSGKTTFLKNVIQYFNNKLKIAIVQNEFAPASFDGQELKRTSDSNFEILEVNNGSVFCVCLLSGFITSLKKFAEQYQPECIFMEASGLSDPVSIGQIFGSSELTQNVYLAGTICIADGAHFEKFENLLPGFMHQIQIADVVILNKMDKISNEENIISKIKKLSPFAAILPAKYCNTDIERIFSDNLLFNKKHFMLPGKSVRPDIQSVVFKTPHPVAESSVSEIISSLSENAIRTKGYILTKSGNSVMVQVIAGNAETEIVKTSVKQTELIIIGKEISLDWVHAIFQKF